MHLSPELVSGKKNVFEARLDEGQLLIPSSSFLLSVYRLDTNRSRTYPNRTGTFIEFASRIYLHKEKSSDSWEANKEIEFASSQAFINRMFLSSQQLPYIELDEFLALSVCSNASCHEIISPL